MQDDPRREIERQASIAERLDVEADPVTGERYVVLDGRLVGKLVWSSKERWGLFYATGEGYVDSHHGLMGKHDDFEEADRHGVGWVAHALASDSHPLSGERR